MSPRRPKPIPATSPFDEYEHMRALRCACGAGLGWGERECERQAPPRDRFVLDRYPLTCARCGHSESIEFLCDTGSPVYSGLTESLMALAAGLGPEGSAAVIAASELLGTPRARTPRTRTPRTRSSKPKKKSEPARKPGRKRPGR